jgi:hypothetical protein
MSAKTEYQKRYRQKNREAVTAYVREYHRKLREKSPNKMKNYLREWRQKKAMKDALGIEAMALLETIHATHRIDEHKLDLFAAKVAAANTNTQ